MKKSLVQLLNLFQYEVQNAWNSRESRRLHSEMNLLEDDEEEEAKKAAQLHRKKVKLDHGPRKKIEDEKSKFVPIDRTIKLENTKVKLENRKVEVVKKPSVEVENEKLKLYGRGSPTVGKSGEIKRQRQDITLQRKGIKAELKEIKLEDIPDIRTTISMFAPTPAGTSTSTSLKRKRNAIAPKPGDGSGGWYNNQRVLLTDAKAFLERRTRDDYYAEFLALPPLARCHFSHAKNNLRRLLSYMNKDDAWTENDRKCPAVLERALELSLRVELGAKDIAMLPFPMIDFSQAPAPRRRQLQRLLAEMRHTDQALDRGESATSGKDCGRHCAERTSRSRWRRSIWISRDRLDSAIRRPVAARGSKAHRR